MTSHPEAQNEAIDQALAFHINNPTESQCVGARIFHVNENTVRSNIRCRRQRQQERVDRRGQNRILSDLEIEAIVQYTRDMYIGGLGATKRMVFSAIGFLKDREGRPPPSWRWFQPFVQTHPELFKTIKTKPIARTRVSAQDVKDVGDWFKKWGTWCDENHIQAEDIINFDEAGFQIGVASGEDILIPTL
jgi:hypothetical protein